MSRNGHPPSSASIREVAERAAVSVGTVSNVLNHPEKVSDEIAGRVRRAIDQLGFVRNDAARQLRAGASKSVGLIVLDVRNPFFTDIARGAEDKAAQEGLSIILGNSDESSVRESAYIDLFEQQRVHGLLISPVGDVAGRLEQLRSRGIAVVLVDRKSADGLFSSVSVDDHSGGQLAVEHLIALGRRRIAFVGGPMAIRQVADRLEGAKVAVASHPEVTLEVIATQALGTADGRRVGSEIAERDRGGRPDAVFAVNDLVALGFIQGLRVPGTDVVVPDDIAVVGYDDIEFASTAAVPLSSVRQPSELIGRTAIEILLEEANDPAARHKQIVFRPELVVRASTGG